MGTLKLKNPPIVEAIVDIDCDMPNDFNLAKFEQLHSKGFGKLYPIIQKVNLSEYVVEFKPENQKQSAVSDEVKKLCAMQFLQNDKKQLVQVRLQGFSFNRLAPYTSLDDYLPEIKRTWNIFNELTSPTQITTVRIRYINRILIPAHNDQLKLDNYFNVSANLSIPKLEVTSCLYQYTLKESGTDNKASVAFITEPLNNGKYPVVLDISTFCDKCYDIQLDSGVDFILAKIESLRRLKNNIFEKTLKEPSIALCQSF